MWDTEGLRGAPAAGYMWGGTLRDSGAPASIQEIVCSLFVTVLHTSLGHHSASLYPCGQQQLPPGDDVESSERDN